MFPLVESIKLKDGVFYNLGFHQWRLDRATRELFGMTVPFDLERILKSETYPETGLFKCRFLYGREQYEIGFVPYTFKEITSLKVVVDNSIEYTHKYANRAQLDQLWKLRGSCDDILIVKNDKITDAYSSNITFRKGMNWFTPASHLLPGTTRKRLIDTGVLKETEITIKDISRYEAFKLINAMTDFDRPEFPVSNIVT